MFPVHRMKSVVTTICLADFSATWPETVPIDFLSPSQAGFYYALPPTHHTEVIVFFSSQSRSFLAGKQLCSVVPGFSEKAATLAESTKVSVWLGLGREVWLGLDREVECLSMSPRASCLPGASWGFTFFCHTNSPIFNLLSLIWGYFKMMVKQIKMSGVYPSAEA